MHPQRYTDPATGHQYEVGPDGVTRWVTPAAPGPTVPAPGPAAPAPNPFGPPSGPPVTPAPGAPVSPQPVPTGRRPGVAGVPLPVVLAVAAAAAALLLVVLVVVLWPSGSSSAPGSAGQAGPAAADGITIVTPPGTVRQDDWVIDSAHLERQTDGLKWVVGGMTLRNDSTIARSGLMIVTFTNPTTKAKVYSYLEIVDNLGPGETRQVAFRLPQPYVAGPVEMSLEADTKPPALGP